MRNWSWGFVHRARRSRPRNFRFRPGFVALVDVYNMLSSSDGTVFFPGCDGTPTISEGKCSTHAGAMSPSQPQISQWRWGFLHLTGLCKSRGFPFRNPDCSSGRSMEGLMIRDCDIILPWWCGTPTLSSVEILAARWLHEIRPT